MPEEKKLELTWMGPVALVLVVVLFAVLFIWSPWNKIKELIPKVPEAVTAETVAGWLEDPSNIVTQKINGQDDNSWPNAEAADIINRLLPDTDVVQDRYTSEQWVAMTKDEQMATARARLVEQLRKDGLLGGAATAVKPAKAAAETKSEEKVSEAPATEEAPAAKEVQTQKAAKKLTGMAAIRAKLAAKKAAEENQ